MRETITLPLSEEQLFQFISEESTLSECEVNVKTSSANLGENLIYYISNLELPCSLDWSDASYTEKCQMLDGYLSLHKIYRNKSLERILYSVIMMAKFGIYEHCDFSSEDVEKYVSEHGEKLAACVQFLESCILYPLKAFKTVSKVITLDVGSFDVISDRSVPLNLVVLFDEFDFNLFYSKIDPSLLHWYKYQFEHAVYNGHTLAKYFFVGNNLYMAYLYDMFNTSESK